MLTLHVTSGEAGSVTKPVQIKLASFLSPAPKHINSHGRSSWAYCKKLHASVAQSGQLGG